jgi:hypothetical protein
VVDEEDRRPKTEDGRPKTGVECREDRREANFTFAGQVAGKFFKNQKY